MEGTRTFDNPLARAVQNHLQILYQQCKAPLGRVPARSWPVLQ